MFMSRFLVALGVVLFSSLAQAQTPTNFEKAPPKSLAQMDRIQNPDVRALMKAAIRKSGGMQWPVLAPDGKQLIYVEVKGREAIAYALRVHGAVVEEVYHHPYPNETTYVSPDDMPPYLLGAAFSPDGRWLATPTLTRNPFSPR